MFNIRVRCTLNNAAGHSLTQAIEFHLYLRCCRAVELADIILYLCRTIHIIYVRVVATHTAMAAGTIPGELVKAPTTNNNKANFPTI